MKRGILGTKKPGAYLVDFIGDLTAIGRIAGTSRLNIQTSFVPQWRLTGYLRHALMCRKPLIFERSFSNKTVAVLHTLLALRRRRIENFFRVYFFFSEPHFHRASPFPKKKTASKSPPLKSPSMINRRPHPSSISLRKYDRKRFEMEKKNRKNRIIGGRSRSGPKAIIAKKKK